MPKAKSTVKVLELLMSEQITLIRAYKREKRGEAETGWGDGKGQTYSSSYSSEYGGGNGEGCITSDKGTTAGDGYADE